MNAPAIPIAAPGRFAPQEADGVQEAIARVLASRRFVGGPEVAAFEEAFAESLAPDLHCVGVGSGLDALVLGLAALELPTGGTVLVPPNDGGYAALAAQSVGLHPVAVDVDREGLLTLGALQGSGEPGVCAVIVTHLHGLAVDLAELVVWCGERSIALVEDCSQAHGARGVAVHGDVSTFSFYPTKNLGALGDGGAVVTNRASVAGRVRSLREYGWDPRFVVAHRGGRNSRLDSLQAAVLRARLPHLQESNQRRRDVVARYRRCAPSLRFLARDDPTFVAHHAVVIEEDRDALARRLHRAGIQTAVHYPALVADMPGLAMTDPRPTPVAAAQRDGKLTLPCHPAMAEEEVGAVCTALAGWVADHG